MKKVTSFAFYFLFFGANAAYMPYLVLWFQSLDFSGAQIGVLTSLFPLLAMVGVPLWTGLADATRRHRLIMSLSMLVPIGFGLLMPELTSFLPVLILVILFAFFGTPVNAFADSATMAMLGERKELYGRVRLGGTFGWGIASLLFGALIEDHGLRLGFYSFAGVSCLALLVSQGFSFKQAEIQGVFPERGSHAAGKPPVYAFSADGDGVRDRPVHGEQLLVCLYGGIARDAKRDGAGTNPGNPV